LGALVGEGVTTSPKGGLVGTLLGKPLGKLFSGDVVGAQRYEIGALVRSSPVNGTSCSMATMSSLYITGSGVNSHKYISSSYVDGARRRPAFPAPFEYTTSGHLPFVFRLRSLMSLLTFRSFTDIVLSLLL
jgi:hypothetical protein